jgi:undecaprenyl-diphosphatase
MMQLAKALVSARTAFVPIALGAVFACDVSYGGASTTRSTPPQDTGIWSRSNQKAVEDLTVLTVLGERFWLGSDNGVGHTFWQSVDSTVLGAATAAVMKPVFSRARPTQTDDPGDWFQGHGHNSFPSGEVMLVTTAVTPFVLEYGLEHPAVYALELLPIYDRRGARQVAGALADRRAGRASPSARGSVGTHMSASYRSP